MRFALAAALVLTPLVALAQTPVERARTLIAGYHEDARHIDEARDLLEAAIARARPPEAVTLLSRIYFLYGEVRATTADDKLAAFGRGRDLGKLAVELAPRSEDAHVWYALNVGRWGQTKGMMRSLSLLPLMREEIDTVLALDPKFPPAYSLAGHFYLEVPGMLGGDVDRAEKLFRTGLELDPTFTSMRVGLAKTLVKKGRVAEARKELEAVLAEKAPHNLADWTLKDSVEARELLGSVRSRPGG